MDSPGSQPISQSLPLRSTIFGERECIGYFGGLLPEDYNRELIARNLGISQKMAMKIGGEYLPDDLRLRHWESYWNEIGFSIKQAQQRTRQFLEKMEQILPDSAENLTEKSIQRCVNNRLRTLHKTVGI